MLIAAIDKMIHSTLVFNDVRQILFSVIVDAMDGWD